MPMIVTPWMWDALTYAKARDGLRRIHDTEHGRPPWPVPFQTLYACVRHGLLDHTQRRSRHGHLIDEWKITQAGLDELDPPPQSYTDRPVYLARPSANSGDYTTNPARSVDVDQRPDGRNVPLEVLVLPEILEGFAAIARKRRVAHLKDAGRTIDAMDFETRLQDASEAARDRHVDINRETRLIRYMQDNGRAEKAMQRLTALEIHLGRRAA